MSSSRTFPLTTRGLTSNRMNSIIADEDAQSSFVVARHEPAGVAPAITRELIDRSSIFAGHVVFTGQKLLEKRDVETRYPLP